MSNIYIPNNEHYLKRARNIRNELLNRTDRYFLIDYPISAEQQMILKTYRQELRDFINEFKDTILKGVIVDFPKQPDFIDLNIIYQFFTKERLRMFPFYLMKIILLFNYSSLN